MIVSADGLIHQQQQQVSCQKPSHNCWSSRVGPQSQECINSALTNLSSFQQHWLSARDYASYDDDSGNGELRNKTEGC